MYITVYSQSIFFVGVNKNKMIMVTVPDDGGFPSVTLGFVGLYGTLAGMSAKGLTGQQRALWGNHVCTNVLISNPITSPHNLW